MPMGAGLGAAVGGGLSAAGSLGSGLIASGASKDAAKVQEANLQRITNETFPDVTAGYSALGPYQALVGAGPFGGMPDYLTQAAGMLPLQMTQAQLEQTPGYQFTRDQGLKAVQSAAAARGLGVSGSALKGAAEYATQLANKTYQNQFDIANARFQDMLALNTGEGGVLQNYNTRLQNLAALGVGAATQTGANAVNATNALAGTMVGAGNQMGAGLSGAGNALNQAYQNYLGYNAYNNAVNATVPTSAAGLPPGYQQYDLSYLPPPG